MTFFVIQWYNYVDKAYFYLMVYILLGFTDIGVKNYFKSNGIKAPISIFLAIVIFFSSISAFGAELMPKAFSPLKWDKLEEWFYDTFPFTREWRNGVGKEEGAVAEETFFTFTSDLGGPVKALNSVVMKVVGDEATYLRGLVYDQYVTSPLGKSRWSNHSQQYEYKEVGEVLPVTFSEKVKYQVKSLKIIPVNIRSDILFSPWQPYEVSDAFYYEKDNFNLKAKTSHATGGSYVVTYLKPQIDLKDLKEKGSTNLSEEDKKRYLSYPLDLPERVKELAYSITKDKTNQYDKVKAVEEYLRRLPYSLDVPPVPAGRDFVDYFLFDLKKGYCTHYATAMAVMLRTIGIPTRYVVGFKMPHFTNKNGEYVITMAEAHSWVEVYFDDYGWVTFEPTPYYPSIEFPIFSSYSSSNIYGEDILPDNKEEVNPKGSDGIPLPEEKSNPSSAKSVSTDEKSKLIKAVVSFALLCTSLVTLVWSIIKLRRKKELYRHEKKVIIYYYDKILKKLSNKGFKMEDFETTIEYGMRVAEAGYEDFIEITDIYNRIVYGSKKPSAAEIKRMKEFFDSLNRRGKFDIKRILRI
jgi:transglutaminase-like putative cysteine protease